MNVIKGFVRAGFMPTCHTMDSNDKVIEVEKGGVKYSKNGKVFISLKFDSRKNEYRYMGITMFYPGNIPQEYREHEFMEFYQENFGPKFYPEDMENELGSIMLDQFFRVLFGKALLKDED